MFVKEEGNPDTNRDRTPHIRTPDDALANQRCLFGGIDSYFAVITQGTTHRLLIAQNQEPQSLTFRTMWTLTTETSAVTKCRTGENGRARKDAPPAVQ